MSFPVIVTIGDLLSNDSNGRTCSPISCGSFSVNNSNQCPSVELFLNNTVLVQCDDGYSLDGTPEGSSNFTVTCLKTGQRAGEGSCAKIVCQAPHVDNADSSNLSAYFNESITWTCLEGFTSTKTGEGQLSLTCASNGNFSGQGSCSKVVCNVTGGENTTVTPQIDSGSVTYGSTNYKARCRTGHVCD